MDDTDTRAFGRFTFEGNTSYGLLKNIADVTLLRKFFCGFSRAVEKMKSDLMSLLMPHDLDLSTACFGFAGRPSTATGAYRETISS
jgi:hypothetical protein